MQKKKPIKRNKSHIKQYLNAQDKLKFYLSISYKKTNLFFTFYMRNKRINKIFIIKKKSCGYLDRKNKNINMFQRSKYKRRYGHMRLRLLSMYIKIIKFFNLNLEFYKFPLFIHWKIYKLDNSLFNLYSKNSFLNLYEKYSKLDVNTKIIRNIGEKYSNFYRLLEEVKKTNPQRYEEVMLKPKLSYMQIARKLKINYNDLPEKNESKNKLRIEKYFIKVYNKLFLKFSHNGCKLSKRRFIKKRRAKKIFVEKKNAFNDFRNNLLKPIYTKNKKLFIPYKMTLN